MNSLSTNALVGVGAAMLAALVSIASIPSAASAMAALVLVAVGALVAFAAQFRRLRDDSRLVYRPVYVRRQSVQRRVTSDDE